MLGSFFRKFDISTERVERDGLDTDGAAPLGPYCSLEWLMGLRWQANKLSLPKAKRASRPQSGMHHSRFRGRGMEFSEVRHYQPGDDVRSIDWRVTARRQTPHTKLFNEERERPVMLICDQSQSQFFGSQLTFKSVRAAECTALFAWTTLTHNDRVGGIVFSESGHQEIKPARNRKTILRLLNTVCDFNHSLSIDGHDQDAAFSLDDALTETIRVSRPGTLIVLISDFHQISEDTEKRLARLAQHNELLMIRTFDPLEDQLPLPGHFPVSNGEDTIMIDASTKHTRDAYARWANDHHARLQEISIRCRAHLIDISTHQSPLLALQQVLQNLGK